MADHCLRCGSIECCCPLTCDFCDRDEFDNFYHQRRPGEAKLIPIRIDIDGYKICFDCEQAAEDLEPVRKMRE